MPVPPGLAKPHRILALIPVVAAAIFVFGSLGLALTHLSANGPGPKANAPQSQIASGQTPPDRGPYTSPTAPRS
ncbi:MAG: hypothetical protein JF588_08890 [Caulobacterales bacterium]|nr:hypothetical protein [Caulobacterales bacterium]